MIILDYIYYQLTNLYKYFNKDGLEKAYGIMMTCALPWWNIILIIMILDNYYYTNIGPSNKYGLLLYGLPIVLLIGLRYWKYTSYDDIKEKVKDLSKTIRIVLNILLVIYILISLFGMIGFAGYIGVSRHRQ